jgi:RNA polymerase sigma-70 factor (ECF subfamily)
MSDRYLNTDQARQLAMHWAKAEPIVRIYIASAIGQHHLIDDIVQEVATIVTEKFDTYHPDQEFSRWAIGIAKNRVAKAIRTKVRDRHVFSTKMIGDLADVVADLQPEADARKSALKHCLEGLKGRSRRIIEMRYQWGRQVQKIAEELGMSRVAVSAVLLRSRKALGDCIEARTKKGDSLR